MKKKINDVMIKASYDYAKRVYRNEIEFSKALDLISTTTQMDRGSALAYVTSFRAMMDGQEYHRTMNTAATQYYLENILKDYGLNQLVTALVAVDLHTKYYSNLKHGSLRSIERLVKDYKESIETQLTR